jgi:hypothetical protein
MYIISELTGKIYLNGAEIPLDDSTQEFQQYLEDKDISGFEYVSATESELAEIESKRVLKEETEMYKKRQCDGVLAYAEISAEFRLAKLSGLLTEEQHGAIESVLIPVRNEVLAGQWKSALKILEDIGVAIGTDLYNRLHTQITNYISQNY